MKQKFILIAIVVLCVAILGFGIAGGVFLGRLLPQAQRPRIANAQAVAQFQSRSQPVTGGRGIVQGLASRPYIAAT